MKQKQLKRLYAALLLCCTLTGCSLNEQIDIAKQNIIGSEEETQQKAEYFGLAYYPAEKVNPVIQSTDMNSVLIDALYESMIYLDENFQAQPMLCESWEGDGTTFEFHIKNGVTFWSGDELTADDVVYTLKTAQGSEISLYKARFTDVKEIYAKDDHTVVITLNQPNMQFPKLMDIPIFKEATETEQFSEGTGAYMPVEDQGSWHLEPYADWHGGSSAVFDKISLIPCNQSDAVTQGFDMGDISLIYGDRIGINNITASGSAETYKLPTTCMHYLGISLYKFPDAKVRQAISYAIDRSDICDVSLKSFAAPAVLPVNPQPDNLEHPMKDDRALALEALAQVNILDNDHNGAVDSFGDIGKISTNILVNEENAYKVMAANQIAENLTAIGIETYVDAVPFEDYQQRLISGNFELYYGEVRMTPDFDLRGLLCTGGALNYSYYQNTQTEDLIYKYRATGTDAAKDELYNQLLSEMPIIPIAFSYEQVMMRSNLIRGFSPSPYWIFHGVGGWRIE